MKQTKNEKNATMQRWEGERMQKRNRRVMHWIAACTQLKIYISHDKKLENGG